MRLHIALDDDVVAELDGRVGPRRRSAFVVADVRAALRDERRWDDWDDDPAAWVRDQRSDARRTG